MRNKSSSTRDEILYMLKVQKRLTVTEMAKQLGITEMAVRRHLHTLDRDQYVESVLERQAMGRPMNIYQLSQKGEELYPRNYKNMALDLLVDVEELGGKKMVDQIFENRQTRLKKTYEQRLGNKSFAEKVSELANIQNENGYMVELDKKEDGAYHLKEFNCPISDVAKDFNKACECELQLFRELLDTDYIKAESCLAAGDDYCNYVIKSTEKKES